MNVHFFYLRLHATLPKQDPCHRACPDQQAQLTPSETKLIAYVNAHLDPARPLLTNSVNSNSGTLNIEGVKKVGALYAAELQKLGFTIEWVNEICPRDLGRPRPGRRPIINRMPEKAKFPTHLFPACPPSSQGSRH